MTCFADRLAAAEADAASVACAFGEQEHDAIACIKIGASWHAWSDGHTACHARGEPTARRRHAPTCRKCRSVWARRRNYWWGERARKDPFVRRWIGREWLHEIDE